MTRSDSGAPAASVVSSSLARSPSSTHGLLERVGPVGELLAEPDAFAGEALLGLDPPGASLASALAGLLARLGARACEAGLVVGDRAQAADLVDLGAALPHGPLQLVDDRIGLALPGERGCELRVGGDARGLGELAEPLELGLEASDRGVQLPLLLCPALSRRGRARPRPAACCPAARSAAAPARASRSRARASSSAAFISGEESSVRSAARSRSSSAWVCSSSASAPCSVVWAAASSRSRSSWSACACSIAAAASRSASRRSRSSARA